MRRWRSTAAARLRWCVSCAPRNSLFSQFEQSEHDQQNRPGAAEAQRAHLVDGQQHAQGDHQNRPAHRAHDISVHACPPPDGGDIRAYSIYAPSAINATGQYLRAREKSSRSRLSSRKITPRAISTTGATGNLDAPP